MWFCPECYSQYRKHEPCACESTPSQHMFFCAPGELPLVCGHLTLLNDTPQPRDLLEEICDGPLLYQHDPSQSHCCCWRHKANTLWVWQGNLENLPRVGAVPQEGETATTLLLRVMPLAGLLLIEAPQSTPLFLAHYARNKTKGLTPPALSLIIDRLQSVFKLSAPRRRAIALLDPAGSTSGEDRRRLAMMSQSFNVFADRSDAFRWLLKQGVQSSNNFRCVPRDHVTTNVILGAREPVPPTLLKQNETAPLPLVGLVDIGGTAGRQLLARIHRETYLATTADKWQWNDEFVVLPGSRRSLSRLRTGTEAKLLRYGQIQELRDGHLAPGTSIPAWTGERVRWRWLGVEPFILALQEAFAVKKFDSLIIGVGDSRFFGQRELASFLEQLWQGSCLPAAIIRADRVNTDLFRWVRNEFPQTPQFPDSWDGGMQALDTALRAAQRRMSA